RRVVDDVEMDVLTLGGPLILPVTPALAFYDDYLILTTDAKMVGQIRDVDLGRAQGVYTNSDYLLVEKQLSGYHVGGFVSADELVKLLAMTPGLELPEAVGLLGGYFQLVSVGGGLKDGLAEGVLLVSTRTYSPDSTIPQSEISTGLPWWLWLAGGLGALLIVILLVVRLGSPRREV
ncbi:hypothetical protein KAU45_00915, partial [bacterium]|nr:hypothetical protein [bacterium]